MSDLGDLKELELKQEGGRTDASLVDIETLDLCDVPDYYNIEDPDPSYYINGERVHIDQVYDAAENLIKNILEDNISITNNFIETINTLSAWEGRDFFPEDFHDMEYYDEDFLDIDTSTKGIKRKGDDEGDEGEDDSSDEDNNGSDEDFDQESTEFHGACRPAIIEFAAQTPDASALEYELLVEPGQTIDDRTIIARVKQDGQWKNVRSIFSSGIVRKDEKDGDFGKLFKTVCSRHIIIDCFQLAQGKSTDGMDMKWLTENPEFMSDMMKMVSSAETALYVITEVFPYFMYLRLVIDFADAVDAIIKEISWEMWNALDVAGRMTAEEYFNEQTDGMSFIARGTWEPDYDDDGSDEDDDEDDEDEKEKEEENEGSENNHDDDFPEEDEYPEITIDESLKPWLQDCLRLTASLYSLFKDWDNIIADNFIDVNEMSRLKDTWSSIYDKYSKLLNTLYKELPEEDKEECEPIKFAILSDLTGGPTFERAIEYVDMTMSNLERNQPADSTNTYYNYLVNDDFPTLKKFTKSFYEAIQSVIAQMSEDDSSDNSSDGSDGSSDGFASDVPDPTPIVYGINDTEEDCECLKRSIETPIVYGEGKGEVGVNIQVNNSTSQDIYLSGTFQIAIVKGGDWAPVFAYIGSHSESKCAKYVIHAGKSATVPSSRLKFHIKQGESVRDYLGGNIFYDAKGEPAYCRVWSYTSAEDPLVLSTRFGMSSPRSYVFNEGSTIVFDVYKTNEAREGKMTPCSSLECLDTGETETCPEGVDPVKMTEEEKRKAAKKVSTPIEAPAGFENMLANFQGEAPKTISRSTPLTWNYLAYAYKMAAEEWESGKLFSANCCPDIYNYRGSNDQYEELAYIGMQAWLMAMCLAELIPSKGTVTNKQTELYKKAYDLGGGKSVPLYGNYTFKGDLMVARLVAGAVYAKNRSDYTFDDIDDIRSEIGGKAINKTTNWTDMEYVDVKNVGYNVATNSIFPSAPGPYVKDKEYYEPNRRNTRHPRKEGQPDDLFYGDGNSDSWRDDNYKVDVAIDDEVVAHYNLEENDEYLKRTIQAVADDSESTKLRVGEKTYYKLGKGTYGHRFCFSPGTPEDNDGYFVGTFSSEVTGVDLSSSITDGYGNETNLKDFFDGVRYVVAHGREQTLQAQRGRRRPAQGTREETPRAGVGGNYKRNWLDDKSLSNIVGSGTKYDKNGQAHSWFVDSNGNGYWDTGEPYYKDSKTFTVNPSEDLYSGKNIESTTYPSGHSAGVWGNALFLIQIFPEKYVDIFRAAYAYSVSRTIVRAHWNSDVTYGRTIGTMMVPVLNATRDTSDKSNDFRRIFENAFDTTVEEGDPDNVMLTQTAKTCAETTQPTKEEWKNHCPTSGSGFVTFKIKNESDLRVLWNGMLKVIMTDGTSYYVPYREPSLLDYGKHYYYVKESNFVIEPGDVWTFEHPISRTYTDKTYGVQTETIDSSKNIVTDPSKQGYVLYCSRADAKDYLLHNTSLDIIDSDSLIVKDQNGNVITDGSRACIIAGRTYEISIKKKTVSYCLPSGVDKDAIHTFLRHVRVNGEIVILPIRLQDWIDHPVKGKLKKSKTKSKSKYDSDTKTWTLTYGDGEERVMFESGERDSLEGEFNKYIERFVERQEEFIDEVKEIYGDEDDGFEPIKDTHGNVRAMRNLCDEFLDARAKYVDDIMDMIETPKFVFPLKEPYRDIAYGYTSIMSGDFWGDKFEFKIPEVTLPEGHIELRRAMEKLIDDKDELGNPEESDLGDNLAEDIEREEVNPIGGKEDGDSDTDENLNFITYFDRLSKSLRSGGIHPLEEELMDLLQEFVEAHPESGDARRYVRAEIIALKKFLKKCQKISKLGFVKSTRIGLPGEDGDPDETLKELFKYFYDQETSEEGKLVDEAKWPWPTDYKYKYQKYVKYTFPNLSPEDTEEDDGSDIDSTKSKADPEDRDNVEDIDTLDTIQDMTVPDIDSVEVNMPEDVSALYDDHNPEIEEELQISKTTIDDIDYWRKYCGIATLVTLPYLATGIVLATTYIKLPCIYIPLKVFSISKVGLIIVLGLAIRGVSINLMMIVVNMSQQANSLMFPATMMLADIRDLFFSQAQAILDLIDPLSQVAMIPLKSNAVALIKDNKKNDAEIAGLNALVLPGKNTILRDIKNQLGLDTRMIVNRLEDEAKAFAGDVTFEVEKTASSEEEEQKEGEETSIISEISAVAEKIAEGMTQSILDIGSSAPSNATIGDIDEDERIHLDLSLVGDEVSFNETMFGELNKGNWSPDTNEYSWDEGEADIEEVILGFSGGFNNFRGVEYEKDGEFESYVNAFKSCVTLKETDITFIYLWLLYKEAKAQYYDHKSVSNIPFLYSPEYFPTLYNRGGDGTALPAFKTLVGWLFALQLSELKPKKRNDILKIGYELGGFTKESKMYGTYYDKQHRIYGYAFDCDPNIARIVAGAIYATMRGRKRPNTSAMRSEVGGSTFSKPFGELGGGSKEEVGENDFFIDFRKFMPTAPGPYAPGYGYFAGRQSTLKDTLDENFNLQVDRDIHEYIVENFNLDNKSRKQEVVQAIADKEAEDEHMFGPNRSTKNYKFHPVFGEETIDIELPIEGDLSDFIQHLMYVSSSSRGILQSKDTPTKEYGRLRPGCSWTTEGKKNSSTDDRRNVLVDFEIEDGDGHPTGYYDDNGNWTYKNEIKDKNAFNEYYKNNLYANSYPSGHSSGIISGAMGLMEIMPSRADMILEAANQFALNRSIARFHWNSDTINGRVLGTATNAVSHAALAFNEEFFESKTNLPKDADLNSEDAVIAYNAMQAWLMASLLAEIVPDSGADTNTQTELFKLAYEIGGGNEYPLYNDKPLKEDPYATREAAGILYSLTRIATGIATFRKELNGNAISGSAWGDLGYKNEIIKNGSDIRLGYKMNNLGYCVNFRSFIPDAPGPRITGTTVSALKHPSEQGQDKALFNEDTGNYLMDEAIYNHMVSEWNMMSMTPLSTWESYSVEKKNRIVNVMATTPCTYMYMFGKPKNVKFDGIANKTYNGNIHADYYTFSETTANTGLTIDGPFSDLSELRRYNVSSKNTYEDTIEKITEIADNFRFPTQDPNYGRCRPGCSPTLEGGERVAVHGAPENELYNIDIAAMVADTEDQKNNKLKEDGFAQDSPRSYVSGHSAQIWMLALMFAQMDKDETARTSKWIKKAFEYSVNRTIARFHWNSDCVYGRLVGSACLPIINAMSGLLSGMNAITMVVNPNAKVASVTTKKSSNSSSSKTTVGNKEWPVNLIIKNQTGTPIFSTGEVRLYIPGHIGVNVYLPGACVTAGSLYTFEVGENDFSDSGVCCDINGGNIGNNYNGQALETEAIIYDYRHYKSSDCGLIVILDTSDSRCDKVLKKGGVTYVLAITKDPNHKA